MTWFDQVKIWIFKISYHLKKKINKNNNKKLEAYLMKILKSETIFPQPLKVV